MPWKIVKGGADCPFEVVKDTGERVACHDTEEEAKKQMAALYANEPDAPMMSERRAPVELRAAEVGKVNFPERIVSLIAAPYDTATLIPYRGEVWKEIILRNAFNGIERKQKMTVNRDHDKIRTVGRVAGYYPDRPEGLVVDAHISQTALGDETLALAADGVLSGSVGMAVRQSDQILDHRTRTRQIRRAFLDHLALVPDPAYESAEVLSVRSEPARSGAAPRVVFDDYWNDPIFRWAHERLESSE